jgi:hypothetical protein
MNINAHTPHVHAQRHKHAPTASGAQGATAATATSPATTAGRPDATQTSTGDTVQFSKAALDASQASNGSTASADRK